MGEHGNNYMEQRYLYEENIRVPLLIYAEQRIDQPKVISAVASQLDLVPTIMDLLHLHGFNLSIGSSLFRPIEERTVFFHNPYVFKNFGCREGAYKFIYTRLSNELELYDLKSDPEEKRNIAREFPDKAQQYLHRVKGYEKLFHFLYAERSLIPAMSHAKDDAPALEFLADCQKSGYFSTIGHR
jgi:arylsulfatase A-like enzyme